MNVPGQGYSRNVPGQGYSRNVSWSRLFQKRILVKVIPETYPGQGYSRNVIPETYPAY